MGGNKFSIKKDDWRKLEKNNLIIALNVLYVKIEKVYPAYVSNDNSNSEQQVILLIILNIEKWHYLAIRKLSALLREII